MKERNVKLCSDGHGEVCYEDRDCPACEAVNEATAPLNNEIARLKIRVSDLEAEIENSKP